MSCLPSHGRVSCSRCYLDPAPLFDESKRIEGEWRITANPLAWGNTNPEVIVLGFSKGPTQAGALASTPHEPNRLQGRPTQRRKDPCPHRPHPNRQPGWTQDAHQQSDHQQVWSVPLCFAGEVHRRAIRSKVCLLEGLWGRDVGQVCRRTIWRCGRNELHVRLSP